MIRVRGRQFPVSLVVIALVLLCIINAGVVALFWRGWKDELDQRHFNSGDKDRPYLFDLTIHFNDSLDTGWQDQLMRGNNLGTLPRGRQIFNGVEFDVRGIVQLTSPQLRKYTTATNFPEQVRGIILGRKCARVHFLHATGWNVPEGTRIGRYVIHYADNRKEQVPILYGRDTGNWWAAPADVAHPPAAAAWQGTNAAKQAVQLFKQSWSNPRPEIEIQSLDFVSEMTRCAPFLIAITAEAPEKHSGN